MIKLNLGCGDLHIKGYENIDIKDGKSAYPLSYSDVDEIRVSHLLEHFGHGEIVAVLKNWVDCLKIGGTLKIAVPDFKKIAQNYIDGAKQNTVGYIMGGQTDDNDFHKCIFDKSSLTQMLDVVGLTDIKEWSDSNSDCSSLPISLNLQGTKASIINRRKKIVAVMSMPRLCFTDCMSSVMTELVARGIKVIKGCGVFWGQVLTNVIESALEDDPDYILTIDYDSWFRYEQIEKMLEIMELYQEADALFPLQIKRDDELPLVGLLGNDGKPLSKVKSDIFNNEAVEAATGHFGLTLIRASIFKELKKPWIMAIPNDDGEWKENRQDADIYFWNNFRNCGKRAFLAPNVSLGHIQLVCTFPGKPEDNWKPIHLPVSECDKGNMKGIL